MKIIKSGDIESWSCQDGTESAFPVLIRNLIRFSTCASIENFHGYNENNRPGVDGKVISNTEQNPWVPCGVSYWELGNAKNIERKASNDYSKRTEEISKQDRLSSTFVFATPKNWRSGEKWVREKKERKEWKNVKIIDAELIEQWIEQLNYPQQAKIADIMGINMEGIDLLEHSWELWSKATNPPLPESMFNEDIKLAQESIIWESWKNDSESSVIVVKADTKEEALAFLYCLFKHDAFKEYSDNACIVGNEDALKRAINQENNIAILCDDGLQTRLIPTKDGVRGILIKDSGVITPEKTFELSCLNSWELTQILRAMNMSNDSIEYVNDFSGKSKSVLRRRLSKNPAICVPSWADDYHLLNNLIPLICLNRWNTHNSQENEIIERVWGQGYRDILSQYVTSNNSPIHIKDGAYEIISMTEVIYYLTLNKELCNIENLIKALGDIALNSNTLYLRERAYSTLIIIDTYRKNCDSSIKLLLSQSISEIAKSKFEAKNLENKIFEELPLLTELAPNESMIFVKYILELKNEAIFKNNIFRKILYSIKILAFNCDYFAHCIDCSIQLLLDSLNEEQTKEVESILESFFRYWSPQTNASVDTRNQELQKLFHAAPNTAWKIALQQIDPYPKTAFKNPTAIWRNKKTWQKLSRVGVGEANQARKFAFEKVLEYIEPQKKEIRHLLKFTCRYGEELSKRIWLRLQEIASQAEEQCLAERYQEIAEFIRYEKLHSNKDADENTRILNIRRAEETLEYYKPQSYFWQNAWLFQLNAYESISRNTSKQRSDEQRRNIVSYLRKRILRRDPYHSIDFILKISGLKKLDSYNVAKLICEHLKGSNEELSTLQTILSNEVKNNGEGYSPFVAGFLCAMSLEGRRKIIIFTDEDPSKNHLNYILTNLPCNKETWSMISSISSELEELYWEKIQVCPKDLDEDFGHIILEHLLENGRHLWVLENIYFITKDKYSKIRRKLFSIIYGELLRNSHNRMFGHEYEVELLISSILPNLSNFEKIKVGLRFFNIIENSNHIDSILFIYIVNHVELFISLCCHVYSDRIYGANNLLQRTVIWNMEYSLDKIFSSPYFFNYLTHNNFLIKWLNKAINCINSYRNFNINYFELFLNKIGILLSCALNKGIVLDPSYHEVFSFLNRNNNDHINRGFIIGARNMFWERYQFPFDKRLLHIDAEKFRNLSKEVKDKYNHVSHSLNEIADDLEEC